MHSFSRLQQLHKTWDDYPIKLPLKIYDKVIGLLGFLGSILKSPREERRKTRKFHDESIDWYNYLYPHSDIYMWWYNLKDHINNFVYVAIYEFLQLYIYIDAGIKANGGFDTSIYLYKNIHTY